MGTYKILYASQNYAFFAGADSSHEFIIIEALGSDFDINHIVTYDGITVFNKTLGEETYAIVQTETNEKGAIAFLRSIK